jgi:integrase
MGRKHKLTWQPGAGQAGRWRKNYRGKTLYFPGGSGKSDRAAYQAALEGFERRKREIDLSMGRIHEAAYAACVDRWEDVLAWSLQNGDNHWAKRAENKLAELRKRLASEILPPLERADHFDACFDSLGQDLAQELMERPDFRDLFERVPGRPVMVPSPTMDPQRYYQREVWNDRLASLKRRAAPRGETIAEHIAAYLAQRQSDADTGKLSVDRLHSLRIQLAAFEAWVDGSRSIKEINGPMLIEYKAHTDSKCKSKRTSGHRLEAVKTWVKWLWVTDRIENLPRAMVAKDKSLKIDKASAEATANIKTFTVDQIKVLLARAVRRTKLYILLALNTGMYQVDIASMKRSEVDLGAQTITRKRTKTKDVQSVPTVTYRLWDETAELLKQEMALDGELALLGENGNPLRAHAKNGTRNDAVKNAFFRLTKKTSIKGNFKMLRKSSASLLADSAWPDVVDLFLGHAAAKMSDVSYAKAALGRLAEATNWLRGKYGLGEQHGSTEHPEGSQPAAPPPKSADAGPSPAAESTEPVGKRQGKARSRCTGHPARKALKRSTASGRAKRVQGDAGRQ